MLWSLLKSKFMKRVFAFVGFTSAITLILLNTVDYSIAKIVFLLSAVSFAASLIIKSLRQGRVVPLVLGTALFSCFIFAVFMQGSVMPQKQLDGKTVQADFKIIDIEQETDNGYIYTVKTSDIDFMNTPQNIKVKIKTKSKISADYYDSISALLSFYSCADNAFDSFSDYADGIYMRASLLSIEHVSENKKPLNYYVLNLRLKIRDLITETFDEDKSGLAYSLLTGDKNLLDDKIKNDFKVSGISHIIAVSGLHITLICMLIYYILKRIGFNDFFATCITVLLILLYIAVAGYSKSAIRAGIMIAVMLIAKLIHNKADTLNSLGFAVFLMCLNPFAVTDAGALLTVTAVLGLCVIKPAYDKALRPKNKIAAYFYDSVSASWSVLLSTFPVGWLIFGKISIISIFMNILCIPLMQIALISVFLLCAFHAISFLGFLPKEAADFCLGLLIKISAWCEEKLNVLYLDISNELIGVVIAGLLLFAGISLIICNRINVKLITLFMCVIFAVTSIFSIYNYSSYAYVFVSSSGAVVIYDKESVLIIDADGRGDDYFIEDKLSARHFKNVAAINSDFCKKEILKLAASVDFDFKADEEKSLGDHITFKYSKDTIFVSVYDKVFKIDDDYVKINNYKLYRNIYESFHETDTRMLVFGKHTDILLKEG